MEEGKKDFLLYLMFVGAIVLLIMAMVVALIWN
jgi:hypothetical protein